MKTQFCPYCMSPVAEGESCSACGLTAGTYTPAPHHLPPGTVLLDRYLVGRVLGEGGFGITYIGCDLRLEMKVAIKEYFPTDKATRHARSSLEVDSYTGAAATGYQSGKTKFLREARTMARMDKQRLIVGVRDFFEANNTAYIVMEYVEGTTFKDLVRQKGGRIPAGELLHLMEPLFPALSAMHEKGLIHRDISPDNLMLEDGEIRLLDFGCARESSSGTETMTIALKHGYAPIEQYQRKGQGPWTDVYALCGTIYYCLTGKVPPQALDRLCGDELILPRKLGVDLTENQERALLYGMGIRPASRYQSVQELYAALYTGVPAPVPRRESRIINQFPPTPPDGGKDRADEDDIPVIREDDTEEKDNANKKGESDNVNGNEDETGTREQGGTETPSEKEKTDRRKWIWIGAAGALVLALCVSLPFLLKPKAPEPLSTEPGTVQATLPAEEALDPDSLFADAVTLQPDGNSLISEEAFREALSDSSVPGVILPTGSQTHITSMEFLNVTKPVLLDRDAFLAVRGETCLSGQSGVLYVKGDFMPNGITRTEHGGKIYLADGECDISTRSLFLLENQEDLVSMGSGTLDVFEDHIVTFDEDDVFGKAVSVSDANALRKAIESSASAVRVTGNITVDVTEYCDPDEYQNLYCHKPLCIDEGAALTVTGGELFLDARDGNRGAFLNHGTYRGSLNTGGNALVLNAGGVWEGGAFVADSTILVNFGDSEIRWDSGLHPDMGTYSRLGDDSQLYNLGSFTVTNSGRELLTCDLGGWIYNYGDFTTQGNVYVPIGGAGSTRGCQFWNYGNLELFANTCNRGYLYNRGYLTVSGGNFENTGLIRAVGPIEVSGGTLTNSEGFIWANEEDPALKKLRSGRVLYYHENTENQVSVTSEGELLAALEDPAVSCIRLNAPVTVRQDLTLTKLLCVTETGMLEVNGNLTVQDTYLLLETGMPACIRAHRLLLTKDAALISQPFWSDADGRSLVSVDTLLIERDALYIHGRTGPLEAETIRLDTGGCFLSLEPLMLEDTDITVGQGCDFRLRGSLTMDRGDILVHGFLECFSYADLSSRVRLENRGLVQLEGRWQPAEDYYQQVCPAEIVNYGSIMHPGNILFLTGRVDNQGKFYAGVDPNAHGKATVQVGSGGTFTGNEIIPYDWSYDWKR